MSPYRRRCLIDFAIHVAAAAVLAVLTTWPVALICAGMSCWSFYDGLTRRDLKR